MSGKQTSSVVMQVMVLAITLYLHLKQVAADACTSDTFHIVANFNVSNTRQRARLVASTKAPNLGMCLSSCSENASVCEEVLYNPKLSACLLLTSNTSVSSTLPYGKLQDYTLARKLDLPKNLEIAVTSTEVVAETVEITCRTSRIYPSVTRLTVYRNGTSFATAPEGQLSFSLVASLDLGTTTWQCSATNDVGTIYSRVEKVERNLLSPWGKRFLMAFGPPNSTLVNTIDHYFSLQSTEAAHVNITSTRFPQHTVYLQPRTPTAVRFDPALVQATNTTVSSIQSMGIMVESNVSVKVVAYTFSDYEHSASLLYPYHNLTQQYVVGGHPRSGTYLRAASKSYILVAAYEPNTNVSISLKDLSTHSQFSITFDGQVYTQGDTLNVTIPHAFDVFMFVLHGCDLGGWEVAATKPVAVFSGVEQVFTNSTPASTSGDPTYEQILPVEVLGKIYRAPHIFSAHASLTTITLKSGNLFTYQAGPSYPPGIYSPANPPFSFEYNPSQRNTNMTFIRTRYPTAAFMYMKPSHAPRSAAGDPAMMTLLPLHHWPTACHFGLPDFKLPHLIFRLFVVVETTEAAKLTINSTLLPATVSVNTGYSIYDEEMLPGYYEITSADQNVRFLGGIYGSSRGSSGGTGFATICSFLLRE